MFESIYSKLPTVFQNFAVSMNGLKIRYTRFNKHFHSYLDKFLNESLDKEKLLTDFIRHSRDNSPFWREQFINYDLKLDCDNIYIELSKLPIISKEQVKENIDNIRIDSSILKEYKVLKISTSGTTGSGLVFWQTREMENKQWAVWWRYRIRNGISFNTWCAWFGGKIIIPVSSSKPPFWRVNIPGKQLMFSGYHLNKETAIYYFNKLKKSKISWIHGYPSQIALLAGYIDELKLGSLPDLKIITYGSENMFDYQHKLISRVLKVPIRTHYGLAEGVANISQLKDGSYLVDDDFCYVEFVPTKDKNRYKIIGTNFSNYAFPLIRYDTGDIAIIEDVKGEKIIKGIDGRSDDYIVRPDGIKISRLGFLFKDQTFVKEAQIFQPDINNIIFRVVPLKGYDKSKFEIEIIDAAKQRLGDSFNYIFDYLESIPKTKNGKLRFVVSNVVN